MVLSHTGGLSCGSPMMNSSPVTAEASPASSGEARTEDPLDSDRSATGVATRRPSASLAIEAIEADEFLVLEHENTPYDADLSDETRSVTSGLPAQGVPQAALFAQVPDSDEPPGVGIIP